MIINSTTLIDLVKENKKLSETLFPKLIARLISASVNSNGYTRFPSGDAVFTPGVDGVLQDVKSCNKFVPEGNSIWEIGTNKSAIDKIESDYNKRALEDRGLNKAEYTYIAVVSSILNSTDKQAFCDNQTKDGPFKKVCIIDANDIASWLERHVDIEIWLLKQYGKKVEEYGVCLLKDEWMRIAGCATPNLTFEIFKLSNESKAEKFIQDIKEQKENKIYTISSQYYGKNYACSFGIAAMLSSEDNSLIERCLIVNSQDALNYVSVFCNDKIVFVNFNCQDEHFATKLNNTYVLFDTYFSDDIKLDFMQQNAFINAIQNLGFTNSQACDMAHLVDYNVLALRRLLTKIPLLKLPEWAKNKEKSELIPLLLMGELNMDEEGDVSILKELVGIDFDHYIECLNYWSEINESPIFKFGNIYKICARKECFDYLQVDIFSLKIKRLEEKLFNVLSETNDKYSKNSKYWHINDGSYKWRDKLIYNILDGFIIIADKSKKNQLHFDDFIGRIYTNLRGNLKLLLTLSHLFNKFVELSPEAYLRFLRNEIKDDKDTFSKFINAKSNGYFSNTYVNYILWPLEKALSNKNTALQAFDLLLTIYYDFCSTNEVREEVIKSLSPITAAEGIVAIPLPKKVEYFFRFISGRSRKDSMQIVKTLAGGGATSIMIGTSPSYRIMLKEKLNVTWQEIFEMESVALKWLLETNNSSEQVEILKSLLRNIHRRPFELMRKDFEAFGESVAKIEDENIKAEICREILDTRENILKFSDWANLKVYIEILDNLVNLASPKDLYIKNRYIIMNENFPLLDPPSFDDPEWYKKEEEKRNGVRRECISNLISTYGERVVERIIVDCGQQVYAIWPIVYDLSTNHLRDIKLFIENESVSGLRYYLSKMEFDDVKNIYGTYHDNLFVLSNLPYSDNIFKLINGNPHEGVYWENKSPYIGINCNFEYAYEKFIKFAPYQLIDALAYHLTTDYEHEIKLLKAIASVIDDKDLMPKMQSKIYALNELVAKMDKKYYSDELAKCEFELLPLLLSDLGDYPLGIKKYFWEHPEFLGKLLISLHNQKDQLVKDSIGQKILYEAYCSFGSGCYIPVDYLLQKKDELKSWANIVLEQSKSSDEIVRRLVKSAIINTIACCPRNRAQDVWPIREIADILEDLSRADYDDSYRVSSNFYCAYANRRGVRTVEDGSAEFALSAEFMKYKESYEFSHPITSKALEYIANGYESEGEMDRTWAYLGR